MITVEFLSKTRVEAQGIFYSRFNEKIVNIQCTALDNNLFWKIEGVNHKLIVKFEIKDK